MNKLSFLLNPFIYIAITGCTGLTKGCPLEEITSHKSSNDTNSKDIIDKDSENNPPFLKEKNVFLDKKRQVVTDYANLHKLNSASDKQANKLLKDPEFQKIIFTNNPSEIPLRKIFSRLNAQSKAAEVMTKEELLQVITPSVIK